MEIEAKRSLQMYSQCEFTQSKLSRSRSLFSMNWALFNRLKWSFFSLSPKRAHKLWPKMSLLDRFKIVFLNCRSTYKRVLKPVNLTELALFSSQWVGWNEILERSERFFNENFSLKSVSSETTLTANCFQPSPSGVNPLRQPVFDTETAKSLLLKLLVFHSY